MLIRFTPVVSEVDNADARDASQRIRRNHEHDKQQDRRKNAAHGRYRETLTTLSKNDARRYRAFENQFAGGQAALAARDAISATWVQFRRRHARPQIAQNRNDGDSYLHSANTSRDAPNVCPYFQPPGDLRGPTAVPHAAAALPALAQFWTSPC